MALPRKKNMLAQNLWSISGSAFLRDTWTWAKPFTYICVPPYPHYILGTWMSLMTPFYRWKNKAYRCCRSCTKSQDIRDEGGDSSQQVWLSVSRLQLLGTLPSVKSSSPWSCHSRLFAQKSGEKFGSDPLSHPVVLKGKLYCLSVVLSLNFAPTVSPAPVITVPGLFTQYSFVKYPLKFLL